MFSLRGFSNIILKIVFESKIKIFIKFVFAVLETLTLINVCVDRRKEFLNLFCVFFFTIKGFKRYF